jgi:hypothetical protein
MHGPRSPAAPTFGDFMSAMRLRPQPVIAAVADCADLVIVGRSCTAIQSYWLALSRDNSSGIETLATLHLWSAMP